MPHPVLEHLSRGNFIFLRPDPNQIRRILPTADELLPNPQRIFLENEGVDPLVGFPILRSRQLERLHAQAAEYIEAEEEMQVAGVNRQSFDSRAYAVRWEAYRTTLTQTLENTLVSSLGYDYTALFWLEHSMRVARNLADTPRRLRQRDSALGRDHGDSIKYKVLEKWTHRVTNLTQDLVQQLADEMDERADALFPRLFALMRDNVLLLSEQFISPDLSELSSYFRGYLRQDSRELRQRLRALEQWHAKYLVSDPLVRGAAADLAGIDPDGDGRRALFHSGYVSFLRRHPDYDPRRLLGDDHLQLWDDLLHRLQEFEIVHALRKMLVHVEIEDGKMVCRDRSSNNTWVGGPPVLELSESTRPIDFTAPWVVNPVVQRFGLVYDITDFSATISMLGRAERKALDEAFRTTTHFQRKIDRLATSLGLRLEKYLGDGAFYSGRDSRQILAMAILVQRLYPQYVRDGFQFDKGMRIAINFGEYRLLPLESEPGTSEPRYEYFGHGLVELSRLTTGKKTQEIETFRTYLVSQGYPEGAVNKFFAPMMQRNAELVSKLDEARDFYAYIDQTQTLINEGIVATEPFIQGLGSIPDLGYTREHGRWFIVFDLPAVEAPLRVGVRKLGVAKFKGLDPMPIFEVVDAQGFDLASTKPIPAQPLDQALERLFSQTVAAASNAARAAAQRRASGTNAGPRPGSGTGA